MGDILNASKLLASCYPLTCNSEEYASTLLATQKRREEVKGENRPSHEGGIFSLRPYQAEAVQALRLALVRKVLRLMVSSPTGSGKTEIGMALVKGARAKHRRVAFLCNRVHLVDQTSRRFAKAGISHGVIQGSNTTRVYEAVLVASVQTVAKRGLPEVDVILIDEAHTVAGSADYRALIIEAAKRNVPVIGLSATPYAKGLGKHYDELGGALFQEMIVAATIPELIAGGYLVDCDVYAPSEPDMTGIKQARNAAGETDYTDADVGRAVDKPELVGDIVQHWQRLAAGTPTVCFAANIAHSKHIVESFLAAGVTAEHIDCYTHEDERRAILGRIESGETLVVSNVGILAEGWDFPACRTLILARPTRSLIRYIQMAGRVLRPHASKVRALILDHSGTVGRLGFPTDEFPMVLDDGTPKAATGADDQAKREEVLPKACPQCSYMTTAHKCPVCGHARIKKSGVDVQAGELVLVTKKPKMSKQAFYSQLITVAAQKGYQAGWISNQYREYFGVWPKNLSRLPAEPSPEFLSYLTHLRIKFAKSKGGQHASA